MILQNNSCCPVNVTVGHDQYSLAPGQSIALERTELLTVRLAHTYYSIAPSDEDILMHDMDASIVSLLLSPFGSPSYYLAMDTVYTLYLPEDGTLSIVRQRFRASIDHVYDRFAICSTFGAIRSIQHIVPEKEEHIRRYKAVTNKSNRLLLGIVLALVFFLFTFVFVLALLSGDNNSWTPLLVLLLLGILLIPLAIICTVVFLFKHFVTKADQKLFEKNYNDAVIAECFSKAIAEADATFMVD